MLPYLQIIILLLLGAFWVIQFVQLMALSDSDFPGRHDKVLWAAAFIVLAPLTPFAYAVWKGAITQVRDRKSGR